MKVLHVIPSIAPRHGGPSEAIIRMVAALREVGVDAEIATTNDDGAEDLDVVTEKLVDFRGVPVRFFPRLKSRVRFIREFKISHAFARWFEGAMKDYDVIHVHAVFSWVCTRAMKLCRKHNQPYIVRTLGQLTVWSLRQSGWRKKLYWRMGEQKNVRGAKWVHCTSDQEGEEFGLMDRETPVRVIPHGVLPGVPIADARAQLLKQYDWPADARIWLFLSRWHLKKNLDLLIRSLGELKKSGDPVRLILAGSGEEEFAKGIRQLLEQEGIKDITVETGQVQGDEKELLLRGSDVFALPSRDENFGIALLEALSRGLPALTTNKVDLFPVVEKEGAGIVCEPTQDGVLAAAKEISDRWEEFTNAAVVQKRSEAILEQFGWPQVAGRIRTAYEEITR